MPETRAHLQAAFGGESQAHQKYLAFARKAEQEGLPNIARLFRTTAQAERIHAAGHLDALDAVGATAENLQAALEGETYEFTEMYPPMLAQAQAEHHQAARMFGFAVRAEAVHARLYASRSRPRGGARTCPRRSSSSARSAATSSSARDPRRARSAARRPRASSRCESSVGWVYGGSRAGGVRVLQARRASECISGGIPRGGMHSLARRACRTGEPL